MSRCNICDHLEGYGSEVDVFSNPYKKVRYRPVLKEYLCDDCANSIQAAVVEMKIDDDTYDPSMEGTMEEMFKPNIAGSLHEPTD